MKIISQCSADIAASAVSVSSHTILVILLYKVQKTAPNFLEQIKIAKMQCKI